MNIRKEGASHISSSSLVLSRRPTSSKNQIPSLPHWNEHLTRNATSSSGTFYPVARASSRNAEWPLRLLSISNHNDIRGARAKTSGKQAQGKASRKGETGVRGGGCGHANDSHQPQPQPPTSTGPPASKQAPPEASQPQPTKSGEEAKQRQSSAAGGTAEGRKRQPTRNRRAQTRAPWQKAGRADHSPDQPSDSSSKAHQDQAETQALRSPAAASSVTFACCKATAMVW